jgi:hypothetical protein
MAFNFPPPPVINKDQGSYAWLHWYQILHDYLTNIGVLSWTVLNFDSSTIVDIVDRKHNDMQNMQGGSATERYHLTAAQAALLTGTHNDLGSLQGGTTNQYYHLTSAEQGRVAAIDQDLGTTDSPTFDALTLTDTIETDAPTGGAGLWKLGVANAVSPTSPDRTITVDIGGTVYYLHAKTTND